MNKKMIEIIWLAIILAILQISIMDCKERSQRPVKTILSGGLISTGEVSSSSITIELENNLYALNAAFKMLKSNNIISKAIKTNILITPLLIPNNEKNIININSYLQVKGEIKFDDEKACSVDTKKSSSYRKFPQGTSFIQLKTLSLNGVKQFQMIKEEEMIEINSKLNDRFLNLLEKNLGSKLKKVPSEISFEKEIIIEYQYDHILIETSFSFLNALWNGNTAYIKINNHYYWMDQHNWMEEDNITTKHTLCSDTDILTEKWTTPIRILYKRSPSKKENNIKVTFGYKFHPENNLTNNEFRNCKIANISPLKEIISFSDLYISIK